jgi:hypothetical protein
VIRWETPKETDHSEDPGVDGITTDQREIGRGGGAVGSRDSGQGPVAGCCVCGDEPSGSGTTELVCNLD